jgi:hypothetical protein
MDEIDNMENLYCMDKLDDMDGTPHTNEKLIR